MATQFSYVTLKQHVAGDALKPDTEAGKAVDHLINTALKQTGARDAHWGNSIEKPNQIWMFVHWDKAQHHLNYRQTDAHANVNSKIAPLLDVSSGASNTDVTPSISSVLGNPEYPIVEVLSIGFPSDIDDNTKASVERQWEEFADKGLRAQGLCSGIARGWTVEKDVALPGDKGETGVLFVVLISWASIEQHLENRETEAFKNNIHLIPELPSLVGVDMFHVNCKSRHAKDVA